MKKTLGRASCGGVCHKSWLFSLSTKGKNSRNFAKVRSQHLPQENSASCSGLLRDALEYFRAQNLGGGLKNFWGAWKICSGKKDASKNGFSTSDLYNVSNKASFCVCLSKENWFSVKTRSVKQHRQPLYKSTTIEKSYVLYGLLHKYLRHNHVSITRLVAQRSSRMSEFDVKISITRQSFKEDFLFQE